ncbi:methylated-DNA--[protein]-cysteine S-methyltransferase [Microbacterium elymi]|uniref:Methylated-DNA--[protein]-cysteine S-methyltransferase n=1 Tax=Microbacterium elymi TaxID=2909587 RepID=A0ABY5NKQ1_9MICO|nr:methylated-DNA--[protein]-cysteine S-methyltransferase [Microbacterium elymi]UUT35651.1 methylated-DNA--[protein]-cysteine S-methyltransferase [Microbacterium elymi]
MCSSRSPRPAWSPRTSCAGTTTSATSTRRWPRSPSRCTRCPGRDDAGADDVRRQLDEYFAGTRRAFALTLDWRLTRGFAQAALESVCDIPYGETAGYGEVAAMAGHPRAARAVGNACAHSPFSIVVPVHRVVRADGSIGGYGGRAEVKRFLLEHERAAGE